MNKRSFIIDFGCCLPFGHNLQSVKLFQQKEEQKGRDAYAVVCKRVRSFKKDVSSRTLYSLPSLYMNLIIDTKENTLIRFVLNIIRLATSIPIFNYSLQHFRAYRASKKLFKSQKFCSRDLLFFPSADYYGTRAFLKLLETMPPEQRPSLHLRFIGVLEFSEARFRNSLLELAILINNNSDWVSVSTEVSPYADFLNSILHKVNVSVEPYPLEIKEISFKPKNSDLKILLPGTNRADKGYFDLFNLCKELLFEFPKATFIIQDMKKWDKHFKKKYQHQLAQLSNVELVDAILSRDKIEELYSQAHLVLLPYDSGTYHYRGSAIHYEAITHKVPVIVKKGLGFINEVNEWSSGWIYETKEDLCSAIKTYLKMDAKEIEEKMNHALDKFKEASSETSHHHLP